MKVKRNSSFFGVDCDSTLKQLTITESFRLSKKTNISNKVSDFSNPMKNKENSSVLQSPPKKIKLCNSEGVPSSKIIDSPGATNLNDSFSSTGSDRTIIYDLSSKENTPDDENPIPSTSESKGTDNINNTPTRKVSRKQNLRFSIINEQTSKNATTSLQPNIYEPQIVIHENVVVQSPTKTRTQSDPQPTCSNSIGIISTPKKATPSKNASKSPSKHRSPIKNDPNSPLKGFKSKEGKQLQIKHMELFVNLIGDVCKRTHFKSYLFHEITILEKFLKMDDRQKYVIMKLFIWKKIWYNVFDFCKRAHIDMDSDHDILHNIFNFLSQEGIVDTSYKENANISDLLNALSWQKVKNIAKNVVRKTGKNKEEDIGIILRHCSSQMTFGKSSKEVVLKHIEKEMGFCIKIKQEVNEALSNAYLLATFTNPEFENIQDYFHNVLYLRVVFPEYEMEDYQVFHSRQDFISYCKARELQKELDSHITAKNKSAITQVGETTLERLKDNIEPINQRWFDEAPHLRRFTASHVYVAILSACIRHLYTDKNGDPKLVQEWLEYLTENFPKSRRIGEWYHRLIWIHTKHIKPPNYERAAEILIDVLTNKSAQLNEVDKQDLGKLGKILKSRKSYKLPKIYRDQITKVIPREVDLSRIYRNTFDAQCKRSNQSGRKRNYIAQDGNDNLVMNVEDYALSCYKDEYPGGEHSEGSSLKALLVLFFWDVIYKPKKHIPGVFITRMQTAPLDIFTKYFLKNRMEAIKERLRQIQQDWSEGELIEFARNMYQLHAHEKSIFGLVMHDIKDIETIDVLLKVIDRKLLARIFFRMLSDLRQFRSGMPDLLLWNVDEKKCKFVEVKGEGDRLSTTQELWLDYLKEHGADVEICYVHSKGSKRKILDKQLEQDNTIEERASDK